MVIVVHRVKYDYRDDGAYNGEDNCCDAAEDYWGHLCTIMKTIKGERMANMRNPTAIVMANVLS